jgi:uncharacterized small protein (DUF1192 family)
MLDLSFMQFLALSDEELLEFTASQSAEYRADAMGVGSHEERRQAAKMSDDQFNKKQAKNIKDMSQSDDPIDRRIAALQRQLDRLYAQKRQQEEGQ